MALVLTRKINEVIDIEGVKVSVIRSQGKSYRLMIDAPEGVTVLRDELLPPQEQHQNTLRLAEQPAVAAS